MSNNNILSLTRLIGLVRPRIHSSHWRKGSDEISRKSKMATICCVHSHAWRSPLVAVLCSAGMAIAAGTPGIEPGQVCRKDGSAQIFRFTWVLGHRCDVVLGQWHPWQSNHTEQVPFDTKLGVDLRNSEFGVGPS